MTRQRSSQAATRMLQSFRDVQAATSDSFLMLGNYNMKIQDNYNKSQHTSALNNRHTGADGLGFTKREHNLMFQGETKHAANRVFS